MGSSLRQTEMSWVDQGSVPIDKQLINSSYTAGLSSENSLIS